MTDVIYPPHGIKILNEREEIKQKTMKLRRMKNLYTQDVEMVCN